MIKLTSNKEGITINISKDEPTINVYWLGNQTFRDCGELMEFLYENVNQNFSDKVFSIFHCEECV